MRTKRHVTGHLIQQLEPRLLLAATTLVFSNGADSYSGTRDTHVRSDTPAGSFGTDGNLVIDLDDDAAAGNQPSQGLVRFEQIFGAGPLLIPPGATITSASLTLRTGIDASDSSTDATSLHRMLKGWEEVSTWDSMDDGVATDGVEAAAAADDAVTPDVLGGAVSFDVRATVQVWSNNPASNFGWALLPSGSNGWRPDSSEATDTAARPRLAITYDAGQPAPNQAPSVNAGPDQTVTGSTVQLDGTVTDDGQPNPPGAVTTLWSEVSGPGTVTFANASSVDTTASFSAAGTYVLQLRADDGALASSDDVTISVLSPPPQNQPPAVSAGTDQTITLPNSAALDGTVTDDGRPNPPGSVTTAWSKFSGPGTVTFANASAVDTTASFSTAGSYVLRLSADDGAATSTDNVTITVQSAPSTPTVQQLNPVSTTENTGEKPQSKAWKYANTWWSVFPNGSGTWVWRLDNTTWTPVLRINTHTTGKADVLLVGNVTHVLIYDGSGGTRLASLQYVSGAPGTYQLWSQRTSVPIIPLSGGVEIATIAMDGAGRMWLASDADSTIEVRYSDAPYGTWSAPITLGSGTSTDDICDITTLPNGSVGVIWSNQRTERFAFRTHAAGASPSVWTAAESPASQSALNVGAGFADDHMSLAVTSNGTVYAAVKTSYDTSGHPVIGLLVRRQTGLWDNFYPVDTDLGATRPIVVVNEAQNVLMVVYRNGAHEIVYRQATLSNPGSFGSRKVLIRGGVNNVSSTRQSLDSDGVFLAADYPADNVVRSVRFVWPAPSGAAPAGSSMAASGADPTEPDPQDTATDLLATDTDPAVV